MLSVKPWVSFLRVNELVKHRVSVLLVRSREDSHFKAHFFALFQCLNCVWPDIDASFDDLGGLHTVCFAFLGGGVFPARSAAITGC